MSTPPKLRRLPELVLPGGEVLHIARTFRARLRGLLGTTQLPSGHALLLTRTKSVHTLGMRFALDLVWLDAQAQVVHIDCGVGPSTHRRHKGARSVIETRHGEGSRFADAVRLSSVAIVAEH